MKALHAEEDVYRAVELGLLEIDSEGRVWRVARHHRRRAHGDFVIRRCVPRRAETQKNKYMQVRFMWEEQRHHASAHRLVWRHFKGAIPGDLTVNHKDGDPHNNRLDNLELATFSEQMLHSIHVLGNDMERNFGESRKTAWTKRKKGNKPQAPRPPRNRDINARSPFTASTVRLIRADGRPASVLANEYAVHPVTIRRVRNGSRWAHIQ